MHKNTDNSQNMWLTCIYLLYHIFNNNLLNPHSNLLTHNNRILGHVPPTYWHQNKVAGTVFHMWYIVLMYLSWYSIIMHFLDTFHSLPAPGSGREWRNPSHWLIILYTRGARVVFWDISIVKVCCIAKCLGTFPGHGITSHILISGCKRGVTAP